MENNIETNIEKKTIVKNTTANFILRVWLTLANFIFVPFYIKYLGEETYGLITFFATLQTIMNLLGVGLSKSIRREFASIKDSPKDIEKYKLLRSVEFLFLILSCFIILFCFIFRAFISNSFLNIENLNPKYVEITISLMGISIAFQLIASMLQGCLFGMERQVEADLIQFAWSLIKNVGVIVLLLVFNFGIIEFYIWHILLDLIYLITIRIRVMSYIKGKCKYTWKLSDLKYVKSVIPYSLSLLFISLCSIGVDKILVSNFFTLTIVGAYNTASNLGNFVLIISTSVGITLFSRFANLKAKNEMEKSHKLYYSINKRVNIIVICMGTFIAFYSNEIVRIWTGSDEIANILSFSAFFIVLALTFSSAQQTSYEYMLANGFVIVDNIRSLLTFILLLIFEPIIINKYGFNGACVLVFGINLLLTILYLSIVNKKFLNRKIFIGLMNDFIIPLIISLLLGFLSYYLVRQFTDNKYLVLIFGIIAGMLTLSVIYLLLDKIIFKEILLLMKGRKNE